MATEGMLISRQARITRTAISPRLATNILLNKGMLRISDFKASLVTRLKEAG
jgi:hypothetical protein